MASRGGYGMTRLLDAIDWKLLAKSTAQGTRWVGHSDLTALHLGLLAHRGAPSWAGPMALDDFGRSVENLAVSTRSRATASPRPWAANSRPWVSAPKPASTAWA